jgi:predicted AAA+ superfamily ATPase
LPLFVDEFQKAPALLDAIKSRVDRARPGGRRAAVELHHFRTAGGREVDIVVETEDRSLVGIEVKLGATPSESDFSGLGYLRDRLGDRFKAGAVVHTGVETLPFGERLWAVPVAALWS